MTSISRNRQGKVKIESDGIDFKHWIVELAEPEDVNITRDEVIDTYIKTLAGFVGSMEEAKLRIYAVSGRRNIVYAFKAIVSKEVAYQILELPQVKLVAPDFYFDIDKSLSKYNFYGGQPFVNGLAAAWDPKFYEPYGAEYDAYRCEMLGAPSSYIGGPPNPGKVLSNDCNLERWHVVMKRPKYKPPRDEVIDWYIKTVTTAMGSDEEARMKIYEVSAKHYYAFGVTLSTELAYKIKGLPGVVMMFPDLNFGDEKYSYLRGEPFINGQAVPYDPKYYARYGLRVGFVPPYVEEQKKAMKSAER